MHINTENIVASIERMDADELDLVQQAVDRRRQQIGGDPVSKVLERRGYRNGVLQLEKRAYRRKDGGLTERGPYWYFHFREAGGQRTKYVGHTDSPEEKMDELLGGSDG